MKISLDLHDFSVENNQMELLLELKQAIPNFKVSLFTVPIDIKFKRKDRSKGLKFIKDNLDWIQLIPHGLFHNSAEARKWGHKDFLENILPAIESAFETDGLPYEKGFCPPHWKWTPGVVKGLDEKGWWGTVHPNETIIYPKRYYQFNFPINKIDYTANLLKLHGHINHTSPDRLEVCMDKLLRLPKAEWHFITDFVEEKL